MASENAILLGPLVELAKPLVEAVLPVVWTALAGYVASFLPGWLRTILEDKRWAVVHSAALAAAQRYWAEAEPTIVAARINVGSPGIARVANGAIGTIPKIATALGVTEDAMRDLVVAKIGQLQVQATMPALATPVEVDSPKAAV